MGRDRQSWPFGMYASKISFGGHSGKRHQRCKYTPCDPATSYMQRSHIQGYHCTMSAIAIPWGQPDGPSGRKQLPTFQFNHIIEYYTATKKYTVALYSEWNSCQKCMHKILPFLQILHEKVYAWNHCPWNFWKKMVIAVWLWRSKLGKQGLGYKEDPLLVYTSLPFKFFFLSLLKYNR